MQYIVTIVIFVVIVLVVCLINFLVVRNNATYTLSKDNKLIVDNISYNSKALYTCFVSDFTYSFIVNYKFVNAKFVRNKNETLKIIFKGYDHITYRYNLKWEDIKCDVHLHYPNIKIIPCNHKRPSERYNETQKIFWYKKADNLKDYIEKLHNEKITEEEHVIYFDLVLEGFQDEPNFMNHNTDVKFLHIKLRS